jgi:hypothetical protein
MLMSPQQDEIKERRRSPVRIPSMPVPRAPVPEIRAPKIDDLLGEIDDLLKKKPPPRYDPCNC